MKKFITAIIIICTAVMVNCCSTAKNMTSTSYVAEGRGVSMDRNMAHQMAVDAALGEISKNYKVSVDTKTRQKYSNTENSRGKSTESNNYESSRVTSSNSEISNYEIVDEHYSMSRKKWICTVVVSVPFENVN